MYAFIHPCGSRWETPRKGTHNNGTFHRSGPKNGGRSWKLLHFGPSWGHFGHILRPSWGHLGPTSAMMDHLGPFCGLLGPPWAILGPFWAILGSLFLRSAALLENSRFQGAPRSLKTHTNATLISRRLGRALGV